MGQTLSIGDFSRATHLSVKTLRHYHQVALLEPAQVNPETGYRYYRTDQIGTAQIIRRFRDLNMPIDDVRAVITTTDPDARNALIAAHLNRLEGELAQTRAAVSSLRDLLEHPDAAIEVEQRRVPATRALGIVETVDREDVIAWWYGALAELYATLAASGVQPAGPSGGIWASALFQHERGEVIVFVPVNEHVRPVGRVDSIVIPAAELAVTVHRGSHSNVDVTYGALAAYVTRHALGVQGAVREYYRIGPHESEDPSEWVTDVCWPIFLTASMSD
jgi:DNA-binding transcriptional MerR regulator/effector-binding domain-containing protein